MKYLAIVVSILFIASVPACSKKKENIPAGGGGSPQTEVSGDLYFPPEEKPVRTEEVDLAALLEEYITPHLKVLGLREEDKEALPQNAVAIRFNYPMVAKEKIGVPSSQGIWSFIPYRAGIYLWKDETVLTFVPNRPWDSGETVTGVLPTNLASLNGFRLLEPHEEAVEFSGGIEIAGKLISLDDITPGEPKVIGVDPPVGGTIGNVPGIVLIFDQPVLVDYVRGKMELGVKGPGESDSRVVPHELLHAKDAVINGAKVAESFTVLVKPIAPLPHQSEITLTFAAGLKEAETYAAKFQTPMPLRLEAISCQQWTACRQSEGAKGQQRTIAVSDATGFLKLTFNDSLDAAMAKELVIAPASGQQKADIVDRALYLSWDWKPSTNYTIRFTDRFRNRSGFGLASPLEIAVRTGPLLPAIEAPIGLKTIDRGKATAVKLRWRNLSSLRVKQYPVSADGLASSLKYYFEGPGGSFFSRPSEERPAAIDFAGHPEENAWEEGTVSVRQLLERRDANIFFLQYETDPFVPQTSESAKRLSALVQVTDVGLMAKRLPAGLFVEASSMATGEPLKGVAVSVLTLDGSVVASGETDDGGGLFIGTDAATDLLDAPLILAERRSGAASEMPGPGSEAMVEDVSEELLEADQSGAAAGDTDAVAGLVDDAYLWFGERRITPAFFELPPSQISTIEAVLNKKGGLRGFVFTDKGIYREGQVMHIKGYADLPSDAPVRDVKLTLHAKTGEDAVVEETASLGSGASFQRDVNIASPLAPGRYRLDAAVVEGDGPFASADILIADSTKAAFEVGVANPKQALLAGEPWQVEIRPEYFFGLPVVHGSLEYSAYSTRMTFEPPGFENYVFSDSFAGAPSDSWDEAVTNEKAALASSGINRLSISTPAGGGEESSLPMRWYLSATVRDISGEAMMAEAEAVSYPSDYYVGLGRRAEFSQGRPIAFEWVALSAIDHRVLSGIEATAELYRLEDHWYQEEGVDEESYYQEGETLKKLVATCRAISSAGRAGCSLGAQPPGRYALKLSSKSTNGAMVAASEEVVIAGGGSMPGAESKRHLVKPTMDRERYAPGETASVLFENPFPKGFATITVEGETILDRMTVPVHEGMMRVPLKVREEYAPNVFVGVHVAAGRRGQGEDGIGSDVAGPTFLVGAVPLRVDLMKQRLTTTITADKGEYQPGERAEVTVALTDGSGRPVPEGEVTLYAVDEAALEPTKYKTPQPLAAMYPERPLAAEIADNRTKAYSTDYLLSVMEKGQVGGDGGMAFDDFAKKTVRKEFPDTLLWKPNLTTDANGRVTVPLKLGDATGGIRLMAVAQKGGKLFGSAELPLRVALPMSAELLLPSFLVRGDAFVARVRIHNTTREAASVAVRLLAPRTETKELRVGASGTAVATFALEALAEGNAMSVEIALQGKGLSDAIQRRIPIHDNFAVRTREVSGVFEKERLLHFKRPEHWEGAKEVRVTFSSIPIPDLSRALGGAMAPASSVLPDVVPSIAAIAIVRDRFKDFLPQGAPSPDAMNGKIATMVKELPSYQLASGGMSSWPGGSGENLFETVQALFLLSQVDVDCGKAVMEGLKKRVEEIAKRGVDASSSEADKRIAALTLAARAFAGETEEALGTGLASVGKTLDAYALSMAVIGLAKMGRSQDVQLLLPLLVEKLRGQQSPDDRTAGLLALLEADPKNALVPWLLHSLFSEGGETGNPQQVAMSLLVSAAYQKRAKRPAEPSVNLVFNGQVIQRDRLKRENALQYSLDLPFEAEGLLTMMSENGKPVYFSASATVREVFSSAPEARVSRGIHLFSTIEDREGKEVEGWRLRLGDLYHVRIYAKTDKAIDRFLLDVALPAGLVPQGALSPQGGGIPVVTENDGADDGGGEDEGGDRRYLLVEKARQQLSHTEYRSDRVQFFADALPAGFYCFDFYARAGSGGAFTMPIVRAESAIDAETLAALPAQRVVVE